MENKNKMLLGIVVIVSLIVVSTIYSIQASKSNSGRERIMEALEKGILEFKEQGRYKCCIEPDCTMCYLGEWLWKDGSCYCDDKIMEGKMDDVCPECKSGIEKGFCSSVKKEACEI